MKFLAKFGPIQVGDFVRYLPSKDSPSQVGKIVDFVQDNTSLKVTLYTVNDTGGYGTTVDLMYLVGYANQSEEQVTKPARYNKVGKLECWDVILDQEMDFLEGNVQKYLWRHKQKHGVADLKKAVEYLNKMIKDYDKLYK